MNSNTKLNSIVPSMIDSEKFQNINKSDIPSKGLNYLYQYWPGKNKFFIDGFLIHGPNINHIIRICLLYIIVFIGEIILTFIYLCNDGLTYLVILISFFYVLTIVSMFFTSFIDPGIIPRDKILFIQKQQKYSYLIRPNEINSQNFFSENNIPTTLQEIENRLENNFECNLYRFCRTCNIYRPPKSSHCRYN